MSELALQRIRENQEKHARGEDARSLNLGRCGLRDWPEELFECVWLEELVMSDGHFDWDTEQWIKAPSGGPDNQLSDIPEQIGKLERLRKLVCGGMFKGTWEITTLFPLRYLTQLQTLDVGQNQLSDLSPLQHLTQLQTLDVGQNQLSDLSPLQLLTQLQTLYVSYNQVSDLRPLQHLTQLQTLYVAGNQVSDLRPLQHLTQLQTLYIYGNQLSDLSPLQHLTQLQTLDAGGNPISNLSSLQHLAQLKELDASNTGVSVVDPWLIRHASLEVLNLHGSAVTHVPYEIINQGAAYNSNCLPDLRNWFGDLAQGSIRNQEIKVMVIGNGRVGKSCLIERLAKGTYTQGKASTHAIQIERWEAPPTAADEQPAHLTFWDFGGQDIYHGTHRIFMQSRALFLIVWDWESETQPHRAAEETEASGYLHRNQPLPHWLDYVRSLGKDSPVLIVQNKADLHKGKNVPNQELLERMYTIRDYFTVSAEMGRGIEDLRAGILEAIRQMPEWGMEMPRSWHQARQEMRKLAAGTTDTDQATFDAVCEACGVREISRGSLLRYLHDTGVLYHQQAYFDGRIILDQQWAIEAVYTLFRRDKMFWRMLNRGNGQFNFEDLFTFWRDEQGFDEAQSQVALSFMLSCEICFQLNQPEKDTEPVYVAPQLLPAELPQAVRTVWEDKPGGLHIRFEYSYLHEVFIQRFIARAGHLARPEHLWRRGIWFAWERTHARIQAHEAPQGAGGHIHIHVSGPREMELLARIRKEFTDIHPQALQYEASVSLNGQAWVKLDMLEACRKQGLSELPASDGSAIKPDRFGDFFADPERMSRSEPPAGVRELTASLPPAAITADQRRAWKVQVSQGKYEEVIAALMECADHNDEIYHLAGRFHDFKEKGRLGVVKDTDQDQMLSELRLALIKFINIA